MTLEKNEAAQLEAVVAGLMNCWNAADGNGFAAPFADDADFVNIHGLYGKGKPAIAEAHEMILHSIYAGSTLDYRVKQARKIASDVVLVHLNARLKIPRGPLAGEIRAMPSAVLRREDGEWKIVSFHNTAVQPPPPPLDVFPQ
jgi:uncharacterized protein (TIGR02246 family)